MLTMDVTKLSHIELADAVSQRCSQFGSVKQVTILRPQGKPQIALAVVAMTSANAIDRVVDNLGAAKVASLAIITIEQEIASISPSVFIPRQQPDWPALVV